MLVFRVLDSVECYNSQTKHWQKVASLKQARAGLSYARFHGYILVAGGLTGDNRSLEVLDSVEKYDTRTNQYVFGLFRCFYQTIEAIANRS